MEGAGGRIDYHILAAYERDGRAVYHDVGYVYHTTYWRRNTFPKKANSPPSTRALLVYQNKDCAESSRRAVASSWLALSRLGFTSCVRSQVHPEKDAATRFSELSCSLAQLSVWNFPPSSEREAAADIMLVENQTENCAGINPRNAFSNMKADRIFVFRS